MSSREGIYFATLRHKQEDEARAWITANHLDAANIPLESGAVIRGDKLTVNYIVRDEYGNPVRDWGEHGDKVLRTVHNTVPLVARPEEYGLQTIPLMPREWLDYNA